jgi:NitT/TauT family transport system substrate-binding protein
MRETGAVQQVPAVADFVTDEYMKLVQADAKLREMANSTR